MRKLIIILLSCTFALMFIIGNAGSEEDAGKVYVAGERLDAIVKKERNLIEEIDSFEKEESDKRKFANELSAKIKNISFAIEKFDKEIAASSLIVRDTEKRISAWFMSFYKHIKTGYAAFIADANDISDLRRRAMYMSAFVKHDRSKLGDIYDEHRRNTAQLHSLKMQLDTERSKKNSVEKEIVLLRSNIEQTVRSLISLRKEHEFFLSEAKAVEETSSDVSKSIKAVKPEIPPLSSLKRKDFSEFKGKLPMPVDGRIVKGDETKNSKGVFFEAKADTPVYAILSGFVEFSGVLKGYGEVIIINHGERVYSISARIGKRFVENSESVEAGEEIGRLGDMTPSGNGILYFELRKGEEILDPRQWLGASTTVFIPGYQG